MRPWKAEQLGAGGYALSSFCERTGIESADAVVADAGAPAWGGNVGDGVAESARWVA